MATLNFATTDRKVFTPVSTSLSNLRNAQAGTMIVLVQETIQALMDFCGLTDSGVANWYHMLGTNSSGPVALWDDDGIIGPASSANPTFDTTNWWWYAVDWSATMGTLERFHWRNQTSLGAWTHSNAAVVNGATAGSPGTGGWFHIGASGDNANGAKNIALVAVWPGIRFSDSDYAAWAATSDLWNHPRGRPGFLVECNATTLVDLAGASTYSSANSSGTTLTGGVPPSFTFDGMGTAPAADAPGEYGWGTYGVGNYGSSFGDALGTPIIGAESFSFTEQASVVQIAVGAFDAITHGDVSAASVAADLQRTDSFSFAELVSLAATLATSDALTHSESPSSVSIQQLLAASDAWALTDLSSLQTQTAMSASDAITSAESSSVAADLQRADAGNLSDSSAVAAAVATSDSGGFSDASALQQTNALSANETHTQSDASAVDATLSRSDSGGFTDLSSVAADLQRVDSWSLTESPGAIQSVTLMQASDSWTVAEAVASLTSTDAKSAIDTLTITDTVQGINANVDASELIGLLESSAIAAALLTGEAFSAAELSAVQAVLLVNANDSQTHSEQNSSVTATTAASDSGTFSDSSLVAGTVFFSANDAQSQDEQSAIAADMSRSDSSALNDSSSLSTILSVSTNDSSTQSEQPSSLSAALSASDGSSVTDLVLDLAQTLQKAANDSFGFNESSTLAQIVAITRTDTFTLTAEVAGIVELVTAPYIHHKVPLDGLVQELPVGGTVLAMVADGVIVSAVTTGSARDNATLGTPPTYGGSGTVLDATDAGTAPTYTADATVD